MRGTVVLALLLVTGCGDDGAAPNGPPVDAQRSDGPVSDANRDAPAAIDAPLGDARPADAAIDRPPLPDSSIGDGGMFATPVTPDEVACPQSDGGACMTPAFKCCGHNVRIDCAPASTTCNLVDQACDGQEDCPGIIAQVCCGMGTPPMTVSVVSRSRPGTSETSVDVPPISSEMISRYPDSPAM